jgi:thiamine pyrophosphokinase
MNNWLIIADGEPLTKLEAQKLARDKLIIVLDGALSQALDYGITPNILIGDFDSLDTKLLKTMKKNIEIVHDTNQHTTDLEKALNYLCKINPHSVNICHATGRRLDHTLYNLRLLKRYHNLLNNITLTTTREKIYFLHNCTVNLFTNTNQPLALLAFQKATIQSKNLQYELNNLTLEFAVQESISNTLLPGNATLKVQGDALVIISHSVTIRYS